MQAKLKAFDKSTAPNHKANQNNARNVSLKSKILAYMSLMLAKPKSHLRRKKRPKVAA